MNQATFELQLRQTLEGKAENAVIQPTIQRDQQIQDLLRINSYGAQSTFDYNIKKHYEVLHVGNVDRLISRRKDLNEHEFKVVPSLEEVFGIIKTAHEAIGHGGGNKIIAEGKREWSNITQEVCYLGN
ncbi:KRAB-A domain-containing protein 2-like [Palaemon carinicauda]|uniref:KRAB-A domain-containing protein 2-like n=1 Tax=Palaemon carinicauda TaxID=392227 RepID=UPI0035B57CCE